RLRFIFKIGLEIHLCVSTIIFLSLHLGFSSLSSAAARLLLTQNDNLCPLDFDVLRRMIRGSKRARFRRFVYLRTTNNDFVLPACGESWMFAEKGQYGHLARRDM
ncbi:hypothetical protein U1Q18_015239, partial [Sarracenia purpurea var. burkii]